MDAPGPFNTWYRLVFHRKESQIITVAAGESYSNIAAFSQLPRSCPADGEAPGGDARLEAEQPPLPAPRMLMLTHKHTNHQGKQRAKLHNVVIFYASVKKATANMRGSTRSDVKDNRKHGGARTLTAHYKSKWGELSFKIHLQVEQKLLLRDRINKGSDISIKLSGVRHRKLERRERRVSQSASRTAALEALCCDASSTCADRAAVFTAEKRFPRRPPALLKTDCRSRLGPARRRLSPLELERGFS